MIITVRMDGTSASRCSSAGDHCRRLVGQVGPLQRQDVAVEDRQPVDLAV
jgi:hypothetical protein